MRFINKIQETMCVPIQPTPSKQYRWHCSSLCQIVFQKIKISKANIHHIHAWQGTWYFGFSGNSYFPWRIEMLHKDPYDFKNARPSSWIFLAASWVLSYIVVSMPSTKIGLGSFRYSTNSQQTNQNLHMYLIMVSIKNRGFVSCSQNHLAMAFLGWECQCMVHCKVGARDQVG